MFFRFAKALCCYNANSNPVIIADSILVFTGRLLISETGLSYFRARYYDASLVFFASRETYDEEKSISLHGKQFLKMHNLMCQASIYLVIIVSLNSVK